MNYENFDNPSKYANISFEVMDKVDDLSVIASQSSFNFRSGCFMSERKCILKIINYVNFDTFWCI